MASHHQPTGKREPIASTPWSAGGSRYDRRDEQERFTSDQVDLYGHEQRIDVYVPRTKRQKARMTAEIDINLQGPAS